jgi:putative oxidoreductase
MCGIATLFEATIGILLLIGLKTRFAAIASFGLTLVFALSMSLFLGIKAPVNFAVFPVAAASLLLSTIPVYDWSVGNLLRRPVKENSGF